MRPLPVPVILASRSPRRSQLLRQIGMQFTVEPSGIEERIDASLSFEENVRRLALHKAEDVAHRRTEGIVIGSDTIVVIDGDVLGKPADAAEALRMLRRLSGRTHTVYTGFALVDCADGRRHIDHQETSVTFRALTDDEIADYVAGGSPMDKAGAYGIQDDAGAVFVERIDGCYYTVVGFPLAKFHTAFLSFTDGLGQSKGTL
ncbi:MAG: septum formation inhibitor Maf [Bacteroidetes bacterium]|nr:MAG: septum formation inhibitor Maf [Bacteroidota bacterium]